VVNKWDLFEEQVAEARAKAEKSEARSGRRGQAKPMTALAEFGQWVQEKLFFLDYAPVIFTSAKTGFHLDRLLEAVRYVTAQLRQNIPTALLNRTLRDAIERRQPISASGARLKFFYATQVRQAPPTFLLFVNRDELFSPAYQKYLAGEMRKAFGYEGAPLLMVPKPRPKTIESKHEPRQRNRREDSR
jgi:GTP-binding protein